MLLKSNSAFVRNFTLLKIHFSDAARTRTSNEELASRSLGTRVKSIITGQEDSDVTNIRELNKKLTRMLEEEMTKNMALKQVRSNEISGLQSTSVYLDS